MALFSTPWGPLTVDAIRLVTLSDDDVMGDDEHEDLPREDEMFEYVTAISYPEPNVISIHTTEFVYTVRANGVITAQHYDVIEQLDAGTFLELSDDYKYLRCADPT